MSCAFTFQVWEIQEDEILQNWEKRKNIWKKIKVRPYSQNICQFLPQYPSFEVSSSLRFGACPLEPAFGQVHTTLAWASLYPIDWGWACHWIRIKVLRLSIKRGRAMRGTCQRFVCCQGLVSARKKVWLRNSKKPRFFSLAQSHFKSKPLSLATAIMKIRPLN